MQWLKGAIKKNMIAGLLVTVPAAFTYIILEFVITRVDRMMAPVIPKIIGESGMELLKEYPIPGIGFLLLILFIILVGLLATNFFGKKLFKMGELIVRKIPFVRVIYTSIKKVVDTISQAKTPTFEKMVLIAYPRKPLKTLGIVACDTQGMVLDCVGEESVNVFVPTSPNPTTGFLMIVPREEVDFLEMTVEEGLKMIISFGLVSPE
ncbi:hypothetical protein UR09_05550 [Candidatus Nitromaritima sp. SCGC AAA799-A02]|nr:hypothetical protein UR09_05550 [Candidatus Nitromaritima sp. SCGC AAA799-A02]KMP10953.1 hypothetical protein UZ36_06025 [Candidatus Nitromaritima sp. SCGC AAA799-C22]